MHFEFDGAVPRLNLSAHGNQLWIELPSTRIAIPPRPLFGYEVAPIKSVHAFDAQNGSGKSRIVVEVIGKTDYAVARLPHEIVLRIAPAGADPNIAAPIVVHRDAPRPNRRMVARSEVQTAPDHIEPASAHPPAPPTNLEPHIASPENQGGSPLVVIDPGHGGYDPGTQSSSGVLEKDLALQIATRVKSSLEVRGIRAQVTRSSDAFISLAERTRIANRAGADLFVSIHLNSSPNTETTGIEVYYLNNSTDRATIRLARMENGGGDGYGAPDASHLNLNYILTDLRQNYKASEAASLAKMIDAQTVADLDAGLGLNVNALGAKMGPFYVLVGAHMPAVLVECGFLSNPGEAQRLTGADYQNLLAGAISTAIVHYFNADLAVGNL
ncbi:MAG TPA: N-acetylmuramoyl-L-alanine amidase [Methylomirabilota bacterium]|nr:N-acetylmuramoyl-L-alanine amidase [Methylomirabilota bacterium]